jgi:hypothetical protein
MERRQLEPLEMSADELYSPHFGGFGLNSLIMLEESLHNPEADAASIGDSLGFFFRCFDRAGHQVQWDEAPEEIRERALTLCGAAIERITTSGLDPATYGYGVQPEVT